MNLIQRNWQKIILLLYIFFIPLISFAGDVTGEPCDTSGKICNPLGTTSTIPELIKSILKGALQVGIPLIALAVIYSGFLFVSAQGNSEKITEAKNTLLYTLIGAAILLGSWAIANMIASTVTGLG